MRRVPAVLALGLAALIAGAGCSRPPGPPPPHHGGSAAGPDLSHQVNANSVFGGVNVTAMDLQCAGHVRLEQGAASVNDTCFTGDTNIVLCSDASSASAVQCTPSNGKLALAGSGSDLINYARVR